MDITRSNRVRAVASMLAVVAPVLFHSAAAQAADDKKAERELARRMQVLQQEKSELGAKLKTASDQAQELSKNVEESHQELASQRKSNGRLSARVDHLQEELRALQARFDDLAATKARLEDEKRDLEGKAAEQLSVMARQSTLLDTCRKDNAELGHIGSDLLTRLHKESKSSLGSMLGFGSVEEFNVDQDYRDRLDKYRIDGARTER